MPADVSFAKERKAMNPIDIFGKMLVEKFRDDAISYFEGLLHDKAPIDVKQLSTHLSGALSEEQKQFLLSACADAVNVGMHNFLFALQIAHDLDQGIEVFVDGKNIAKESDGLQGEPWGEEGWIKKFSRFPALPSLGSK